MRAVFTPKALTGQVTAPPSKSMGHRMLICAGLASGESVVRGISESEDMKATLDLLSAMGATYRKEGDTVYIRGTDPRSAHPDTPLNCRECGSTLRFFIPLCLLTDTPVTLTGSGRLMERPLGVYEKLCAEQGLMWQPPHGGNATLTVCGRLHGGDITLRGDVSSQFITGLLLALPLCAEDSVLHVLPPLESRPYIDMTLAALDIFGIKAEWLDHLTLRIPGGQSYTPANATVEGDYSNAAFFDALPLLGHDVKVVGLDPHSLQGDKAYVDFYAQLRRDSPTLDISHCPDLGPILMALGAALGGVTLTGTKRLRIKESDRGAVMARELAKFGVSVDVGEDMITVSSQGFGKPREALFGHNDHRIVMALCTLLTVTGGVIDGAEAVRKSLPDYFDMILALGGEIGL